MAQDRRAGMEGQVLCDRSPRGTRAPPRPPAASSPLAPPRSLARRRAARGHPGPARRPTRHPGERRAACDGHTGAAPPRQRRPSGQASQPGRGGPGARPWLRPRPDAPARVIRELDALMRADGCPSVASATGKMTEVTTLQVVTNQGWMIPYIGCMYVVIGMLAQFAAGLLKFSDR